MAEETAVDFGGFGASADAGEDNLSMPLDDFMAFLEDFPTQAEEGGEEDEEQEPGVNQGCLETPVDANASENAFQSNDEMLENAEFWSNYSHVDPSESQIDVNMELNQEQGTVGSSEANTYELFSNADLYNQSRAYNMDGQHSASDVSNNDTFEDASGPPYEDISNGSYLAPQTMYPDQTQLRDMTGMDTQMNTYFSGDISAEQSGLSEINLEGTDSMLGSAGQSGNHFISTAMFSFTENAAMPDISCTELSMGEAAESIRNGNSSCLTVQEEHLQAECGDYPHSDYASVDMVAEASLHDLPHNFSQNNEQYEMEQFPENICESGSMQMGSPDQYCDDTSLSDLYMDVSSPDSVSFEQIQTEDICFKSESSTDSSPVPSSRNSITEDADKYFGHTSKQLLDSKFFPTSSQQPFKNMGYQKPLLALHKQYDYRIGSSSTQGNSSRGCFSMDGNGAPDLCLLEGNRNPAPDYRLPLQRSIHNNFQQSIYPKPIIPSFGGMRYKPHDERMTLRLALQDISQPRSEANPPDGVLAVPLLRHQKIALSWMVQKETSSSHCSGGILADDQGLGKTMTTTMIVLNLN
ncbi:hypothetical protein QOZ80_1BG0085740 [Eleusine coracana subsp. coracana]|nr:hypothetical protein QOZ80_1BG0085740 [Eleusine coracana subsp. coracana]